MSRPAEIALALALTLILAPVITALALAVLLIDGRPVLFVSDRVTRGGRIFRLVKFRTMAGIAGPGVTGGDKDARITPLGRWLRRRRLDELPQLWNVITGDLAFVGPRPPLPEVVAAAPGTYARLLRRRPGITGLATLVFAGREERLLAAASTPSETEAIYLRRCVPRKARLDLIHARHRRARLDLWLMALTAVRILRGPGGRLPRACLSKSKRRGVSIAGDSDTTGLP